MYCPKCNEAKLRNIKSVNVPWNEIYKQKKCLSCGHTFYTVEFEVEPNKRFKKEWCLYDRRYNPPTDK